MDSPGGRQVTPQTAPKTTATPLEDDAENDLKRFMRGDVEFELEYTDEFMYGYVRGLTSRHFNNSRRQSQRCCTPRPPRNDFRSGP